MRSAQPAAQRSQTRRLVGVLDAEEGFVVACGAGDLVQGGGAREARRVGGCRVAIRGVGCAVWDGGVLAGGGLPGGCFGVLHRREFVDGR